MGSASAIHASQYRNIDKSAQSRNTQVQFQTEAPIRIEQPELEHMASMRSLNQASINDRAHSSTFGDSPKKFLLKNNLKGVFLRNQAQTELRDEVYSNP